MACLNCTYEEQQKKLLTVSIRGEIVREMVKCIASTQNQTGAYALL